MIPEQLDSHVRRELYTLAEALRQTLGSSMELWHPQPLQYRLIQVARWADAYLNGIGRDRPCDITELRLWLAYLAPVAGLSGAVTRHGSQLVRAPARPVSCRPTAPG
jgi:hypothetical protein